MLYDDNEDEGGLGGQEGSMAAPVSREGGETLQERREALSLSPAPHGSSCQPAEQSRCSSPSQCRSSSGDLWDCVICRELK